MQLVLVIPMIQYNVKILNIKPLLIIYASRNLYNILIKTGILYRFKQKIINP